MNWAFTCVYLLAFALLAAGEMQVSMLAACFASDSLF